MNPLILEEGYRFHVQFHITSKCNLNCKHCYEGNVCDHTEWSFDEFVLAIEKLWNCFEKWGVKGEISLIGGEPTVHPRFYDMVEYLSQRGDVHGISILTNGVNIDERFIEQIKKNKCFVQVSIDGSTPEMHDYIRGKGNYEKTIRNVKKMSDAGIELSAHYVLSKNTIPLSETFFQTLLDNGISQVAFSRLVPFGNASIDEMMSKEETKDTFSFINEMSSTFKNKGLYVMTTRPLWCNFDYEGKCPVGFQTITILENGDILPCRRLPITLGNIKTDNFFKIWYTDKTLEDIRNRKNISKCGSCKHLDSCGGARCIAYATTGNYMAEDPQCWII